MNRFWAALRFLTVLPAPAGRGLDLGDLGRSLPFFPVVGLVLGGLTAAAVEAGGRVLPRPLLICLAVALPVLLSGGLHADGLADTADGFCSARPRERILEIMRDSRIGAMGVLALIFCLGVKASALASAPVGSLWRMALCMPVAGRAALVFLLAFMPYVRPAGGLGTPFTQGRHVAAAGWAMAALIAVAAWSASLGGLVTVFAVVLFLLGFAGWCRRKIGGMTGDTLGAACELTEAVAACGLAVHFSP